MNADGPKEPPFVFHGADERRQPSWIRPPENELGMCTPLRLLFVQTDDLLVKLIQVVAYSAGFGLRLVVQLRREGEQFDRQQAMDLTTGLRLAVEYSDGRKTTNVDRLPPTAEEPPPIGVRWQGGGGGGGRHDMNYWISPLPPPGSLTFALDWRDRIAEHVQSVDAGPIIEAARRSLVLWEDDRPYG